LEKKKRIIRRKTGGTQNLYFHEGTQKAIEEFQKTDSREVKSLLYNTEILPAFDKLVENLIFMHGFNKNGESFDTMKNDCITFLYETLYKFDASRGTKAFSYFNVVARNSLIIKSKQKVKRNKRNVSIDDHDSLTSFQKQLIENYSILPAQDDVIIDSFKRERIIAMMGEIKKKTLNENEILCIDAITKVFQHVDDLEFLNKRAIFVYIRDLSNLNAKQLSVAMSQIRKHYREISKNDSIELF